MEYNKLDAILCGYENADATFSINIYAARTKPTKNKIQGGRGAKGVKRLERLASQSHALSPDEATMYRAFNARANYLAQDRPDIAFSTKALCNEFAVPNRDPICESKKGVSLSHRRP